MSPENVNSRNPYVKSIQTEIRNSSKILLLLLLLLFKKKRKFIIITITVKHHNVLQDIMCYSFLKVKLFSCALSIQFFFNMFI
jgi:hypothetical protein